MERTGREKGHIEGHHRSDVQGNTAGGNEYDALIAEKRQKSKPADAKRRREQETELLRTTNRAVHGQSSELSVALGSERTAKGAS